MASINFKNVYLKDTYSLAGPLESEGKIKKYDATLKDYYYDEKTFIDAEVKMQKTVLDNLIFKNNLQKKLDCIIGGDLSNQLAVTSLSIKDYDAPFLGLYSACATFVESLIIGASYIDSGIFQNIIAITSSHNLNAERQFRFPTEYGAPKAKTTTLTATGSVGVILTNEKTKIKIESATIGNIIDYDQKDATNMGAVMAPSAIQVLIKHLEDAKKTVYDYDVILTGDLGSVGSAIFKETLNITHGIKLKNHLDAGCEIYVPSQDVYSGASGPVTLPLVLVSKILKSNKYKKILVIATGSLHSKDTVNQHKTIPSIAHALSLEVLS